MRTTYIASLLGASWATCVLAQVNFSTFGQSLHLAAAELHDLERAYAGVSTAGNKLKLACLTAQSALGKAQVQTIPLNETIGENWYVPIARSSWPNASMELLTAEQVTNLLGRAILCDSTSKFKPSVNISSDHQLLFGPVRRAQWRTFAKPKLGQHRT